MQKNKLGADLPFTDAALVVRGGKNTAALIEERTGMDPSGIVGVSALCAENATVAELAHRIRHGQIGITTVGKIREMGGDVIKTSGADRNHVTLVGLSPETASSLLTPTIKNLWR